jgi:NAD(P)-dependent dehydrogenase (short-subunit alcohol dehydrogenase family)
VKEIGENVTAVQDDVAKTSDLDRLYDDVNRSTGRVDIVFANAGAAELAPLEESRKSTSIWSSASMSKASASRSNRLCR